MQLRFWLAASVAACALGASPERALAQCAHYEFDPSFLSAGSAPVAVAVGDVNGDGAPDLVTVDFADETLAVLLAAGGGYAAPVFFPAGPAPRDLALADLDQDGDLDALVCNEGRLVGGAWTSFGVSTLWNDGAGGFAGVSFKALPAGEIRPAAIAAGDLDLDGDLDVAVALLGTGSLHSKVASFVNLGNGQLGAAQLAATGWGPVDLELGDVDGDGLLDAVTVGVLSDTINVLRGDGDGSFTPLWGHNAGIEPTDVALGDFDGDGGLDAAVAWRAGVLVLRNVAGTLDYLASLTPGLLPRGVDFGDLDGDGRLDLAAVDVLGDQLYAYTGDGAGGFVLAEQVAVGNAPLEVVAADVDGDGDVDLAMPVGPPGGVSLLRNFCSMGTYCTGKTNSRGCVPSIGWSGVPSLSASDFHVTATNELNHQPGIVFFGHAPAAVPFAGGLRCVATPVVRTAPQGSGGNPGAPDCSGSYDYPVTGAWLAQHGWGAGDELFAQWWSRDPANPDGTGIALSDGLRCEILP